MAGGRGRRGCGDSGRKRRAGAMVSRTRTPPTARSPRGGACCDARRCAPAPPPEARAECARRRGRAAHSARSGTAMKIAQLAPLAEAVPPKLYGGTERVVSWLTEELVALG